MRITLLSLIALLLCSCASTVPTGSMPAAAPAVAEKATVYVLQATPAIVSENVPLFVGLEKIGALSLRSYTWFQCEPGSYKIAIGDALVSHRMSAATTVSLVAGEIAYIKFVLNPRQNELVLVGGLIGDIASGKQVSVPEPLFRIKKDEAEKLMQSYELVGNTFGKK